MSRPTAKIISRTLSVALAVAATMFAFLLVATVPAFIRARSTPSTNACVNNLRQLDGAKQMWALESQKTSNDVPAWSDVRPYLKPGLCCPQGGVYVLGRAGEPPRCSLGGTHTLPQSQ